MSWTNCLCNQRGYSGQAGSTTDLSIAVIQEGIQRGWLPDLSRAVQGVWHHTVYESEHLLPGISQDRNSVTMTADQRQLQTPRPL